MSESAKEAILNAAEKAFSEKGFDGARVDQIAKEAGVNKALLYYYFKSKKGLMNALYERLIAQGIGTLDFTSFDPRTAQENPEVLHGLMHQIFNFFGRNRAILQIIFMESLKDKKENLLLDLIDIYFDKRIEELVRKMEEKGMSFDEDKKQWLMTEFFTGLMPIITYTFFKPNLMERLNVTSDEIDHYFMHSLIETHLPTHMHPVSKKQKEVP